MFLPHPRVKLSIVGSLRDREVACSASDRQGSNLESCVWRTVSSQSSHHPQEVLLAQFSLYVHKGGLKPDSFHFFCSNSLILKIHLKEPPLRMNYTLLIYNICVRLKIRIVYYRMYMSPSLSWLSGYSHLPCNSHHGHSNIILEQILPVWLYYYYIYIIIIIIVGMVIWYRPTIYGLDYTISHSLRYYIYAHNVTA